MKGRDKHRISKAAKVAVLATLGVAGIAGATTLHLSMRARNERIQKLSNRVSLLESDIQILQSKQSSLVALMNGLMTQQVPGAVVLQSICECLDVTPVQVVAFVAREDVRKHATEAANSVITSQRTLSQATTRAVKGIGIGLSGFEMNTVTTSIVLAILACLIVYILYKLNVPIDTAVVVLDEMAGTVKNTALGTRFTLREGVTKPVMMGAHRWNQFCTWLFRFARVPDQALPGPAQSPMLSLPG